MAVGKLHAVQFQVECDLFEKNQTFLVLDKDNMNAKPLMYVRPKKDV